MHEKWLCIPMSANLELKKEKGQFTFLIGDKEVGRF